MGTEYSRINWPDLRDCKKRMKNNYNSFVLSFNNAIIKAEKADDQEMGITLCMLQRFLFNDVKKEYIFIKNNQLFDFFKDSKIKLSSEEISKIFINSCESIKTGLNKNDECFEKCFYIFSKQIARTLFVWISVLKSTNSLLISISDGYNGGSMVLNDEEIRDLNNGANTKLFTEYDRLFLNLLFYMSAYPENVLDNPPDERIEDKVDTKQSKTITVSKEISDYLKDTELTPHLRRGHFRLLSSERFVNKKGQVVFVKSSFVKGHAKTVIGEEND